MVFKTARIPKDYLVEFNESEVYYPTLYCKWETTPKYWFRLDENVCSVIPQAIQPSGRTTLRKQHGTWWITIKLPMWLIAYIIALSPNLVLLVNQCKYSQVEKNQQL